MSHLWEDNDETSEEELEYMTDETTTPAASAPPEGVTVHVNARALDTILEAAAHRIALNMEKTVRTMVEERLDEIMNEAFRTSVGEMARQAIDTYLTKPRVKTNAYGEPVHGAATTISELIPKTVAEWMDEKVDDQGRAYGSARIRRLDWIVQHNVLAQIQAATKKAADDVTAQARQVVANHVARFVSEQMVPAIELSKG